MSFDGSQLYGTFVLPSTKVLGVAVLVHGGGVDRNEDGFYTRLATKLAEADIASFRFDWRAHGKSEGILEEMTLLGIVNDISSAVRTIAASTNRDRVHLVGASFGGGLSAYYAAHNATTIRSLVLFNPLLDYKRRLLDEKPFWHDNQLTPDGLALLNSQGWLPHGEVFHMSRPLINELFHVRPYLDMAAIKSPTLTIHGTKDSMVPFKVAERYHKVSAEHKFVAIEGADHGFTLPGDEDYAAPETTNFQSEAINSAVQWITNHSDGAPDAKS